MWINDKKIDLTKIVNENGKIVKFENIPTTTGIGDSTILKCTFENEEVFEIEFMPEEYKIIQKNIKQNGDEKMIEKVMNFVKEIGEEYKPWSDDQVMVRKVNEDFSIEIDDITIFFDNSKIFNAYTLIEIYQHNDYETIAFRAHKDLHQTIFVTFDINKCKDMEWRINDEYKYIEE